MGSTRRRTAGLAAFALLGSGLFASALAGQASTQGSTAQAAAATGGRNQAGGEGVMNTKPGIGDQPRSTFEGGSRSRASVTSLTTAVDVTTTPSATAVPGVPAAVPAPPTVTLPAPPPGFSADAPETLPPPLGVVTPGGSRGGSPAATPEPSTLLLMGTGLVGLYRLRRRK